jgi:lycopene cyclase CruP
MSSFGCQQIRINPDPELKAILEFICGESVKLGNCGIYLSRQLFFKTGKAPSKFDLHREMRRNPHCQALHSQVAQECLTTVAESFKSFFGLLKAVKAGKVDQKPNLPKYRKDGLALVTFPGQAVKLKDRGLRFPLGRKVKAWFGIDCFYMTMPSNLE